MPAKTLVHSLYNPGTKGVSETPFKVGVLGWYPGKSWPLPLPHHQGYFQQGLLCIQPHHSSEQGDSEAPNVLSLYLPGKQSAQQLFLSAGQQVPGVWAR